MCTNIIQDVADLFDGDVKKFINETLVGKQHYLKREKVQVQQYKNHILKGYVEN